MKLAFWILLLGFSINIATGIVFHYIPGIEDSPEALNGLQYRPEDVTTFSNQFNSTIDSSSAATDTSNLIDNILDKLNLGIIKKIQTWANRWLFGFTNLIGKFVLQLDDFMMGIINSLLIVLYTLAFINLFSGKDFGSG